MPTPADRLARRLAGVLEPSVAIVCVGNDMCGDDGAGVAVARQLIETVPWTVYDCRNAPENFLGKIVRARPESVVLVDALHFGAEPGAVRLLDADELTGRGPSTHGPTPLALLDALGMMHLCRRVVLGIQPARTQLGTALSEPVAQAVEVVVGAFRLLAQSLLPDAAGRS